MGVADRRSLSIRAAMTGVTLVVMAAFWLVGAIIVDHAYRRMAEDAEAAVKGSAAAVALAHSRWIEETRGVAAALAATLPVTGFDPDKCHAVLSSTLANSQGYASFSVISPNGGVLCGSGSHPAGSDSLQDGFLRRALETGAFAVGTYVPGRVSSLTVLPTAYPVLDDAGDVAFILVLTKRLDWFQSVAARLYQGSDISIALVDREGTSLATIPRDAAPVDDAGAYVSGSVPLGDGGLTVVASRPRAIVLAAIEEFHWQAQVAVAAVVVVMLLLLFLASQRLVLAPLARLLAGMREIHNGNLDWQAGTRRPLTTEMQTLYQGFDEMVTAVRDTQNHLREQSAALEQSNRDLQYFAYMVSHDLREPLRSVSGFAQLLARRYHSVVDDEGREFVQFITDGAERMSRMLDGVLAYSRVETQGTPLGPLQLDEPLAQAVTALHAAVSETSAEIERPQPLPRVLGDSQQLIRLFQNLLSNSIKFRRPDTVPHVVISARREGAFWEISVADNGIGVPEEGRERIFLLFQRQVRRDRYEGDGIGLAVVKRIVERHGGTIRADTSPTGGTAIIFTLKAAD